MDGGRAAGRYSRTAALRQTNDGQRSFATCPANGALPSPPPSRRADSPKQRPRGGHAAGGRRQAAARRGGKGRREFVDPRSRPNTAGRLAGEIAQKRVSRETLVPWPREKTPAIVAGASELTAPHVPLLDKSGHVSFDVTTTGRMHHGHAGQRHTAHSRRGAPCSKHATGARTGPRASYRASGSESVSGSSSRYFSSISSSPYSEASRRLPMKLGAAPMNTGSSSKTGSSPSTV